MLRKELTDYLNLCLTLGKLHEEHEIQKSKVSLLFDKLIALRISFKKELAKTNNLFRRMTILQKRQLGFLLESTIEENHVWERDGIYLAPLLKPELAPLQIKDSLNDFKNPREIKAAEIRVISMIGEVKKKQLRLELLGMRFKELLLSIGKAIEAYRQQWKQIYWSIYPLGIISAFFKFIRKLFGASYFSQRELNEAAVIGNLAGSIMKMANAPLI